MQEAHSCCVCVCVSEQLGVVSALFNYNLKGKPLSHSIGIADAKLIVFDADLAPVGCCPLPPTTACLRPPSTLA